MPIDCSRSGRLMSSGLTDIWPSNGASAFLHMPWVVREHSHASEIHNQQAGLLLYPAPSICERQGQEDKVLNVRESRPLGQAAAPFGYLRAE